MSDTTAPATDETTQPETKHADTSKTEDVDYKAEAEKWKALSRKNEDRAKENAEAAKRLADIEAAQLSETEKLTKRAEEAERRATELETKTVRASIAAEKGVPADLLAGSTEEELRASADRLIQFRGPTTTTDFGVGKPGTKDIGDGKAEQISREQLKKMTHQEIVEAKKAGRLNDVLGLS